MDISREEAAEALQQIDEMTTRVKRAVANGGGDVLFILWGMIWIVGYLGTQFFPIYAGWLWLALVVLGSGATIFMTWGRMPVSSPVGARIGWLWFFLYLYINLWVFLIYPFLRIKGMEYTFYLHFGAIQATVPMFAYVVMGLWLDHFMLWIGLAVTALTLVGLFLFPSYFWVWMAVTGGGMLLGTGLYIRYRWRV